MADEKFVFLRIKDTDPIPKEWLEPLGHYYGEGEMAEPRMHDGLRLAIADLEAAAQRAIAKHNLTANELIVALAAVAAIWLPPERGET
jgi:hypothetical protein